MWQQKELAIPLWVGPVAAAKQRSLVALQRDRRTGIAACKPAWEGLASWDPCLAEEQTKGMSEADIAIWRVIQSGQLVTATRAH